jgi:hypothetical protein
MNENKTLQAVRFELSLVFGNISEIYQKHITLSECLKNRENDVEMCLGELLSQNVCNEEPHNLHTYTERLLTV